MDGLQKLIDAVEDKIYELEGEDTPIASSSKISSATKATFEQVMNDPDVELGDADDEGNQEVFCCGDKVGTINAQKGTCDIDSDRYNSPKKGSKKVNSSRVMAKSKIETNPDLEDAISDVLTSNPDLCTEIVNLAFSEDGTFEKEVFIPSKIFYNDNFARADAKEIAKAFYDGTDLDKDTDGANPDAPFFRLVDDVVESTEDPGDYYCNNLFDDILGYIMDNIEDLTFPEDIQVLIDEYLETSK